MHRFILTLALLGGAGAAAAQEPVRVVTSLTTYADIARALVGDRGAVLAIAEGDEEPHFVQPKPSFLPMLARADLFVTTGLDLELWVPALLDKAGNPRIVEGAPGYVAAFAGIRLMEVPLEVSRSQGDIHVYGNPHIFTDPLNAVVIARNILAGLRRVAPAHAEYFAARAAEFERRIVTAMYGAELVRILTPATLLDLGLSYQDWDFLHQSSYQGAPLAARLDGWLKQAEPLRGRRMVCYHREWVYFSARFGIPCVAYVEPKPGIPPSPRHVQQLIAMMRAERIPVVFSPNYFDRNQVRQIASRTGAVPVIVPALVGGTPEAATFFDLVNVWIAELVRAVGSAPAATGGHP